MARGRRGGGSRYRTCWWEKQRRRHGGWAESVSVCVCVCTCMRVSDRGAQYRQLIPTGNTAAALLGQCAIVSFIIITACFSSCALSPHPSHVFLQSRCIPFTCRFEAGNDQIPVTSSKKQDGCLYCGCLQCGLKPPENSTPGDCSLWTEQSVCKLMLHNAVATVNSVTQNRTKCLISNVMCSFLF